MVEIDESVSSGLELRERISSTSGITMDELVAIDSGREIKDSDCVDIQDLMRCCCIHVLCKTPFGASAAAAGAAAGAGARFCSVSAGASAGASAIDNVIGPAGAVDCADVVGPAGASAACASAAYISPSACAVGPDMISSDGTIVRAIRPCADTTVSEKQLWMRLSRALDGMCYEHRIGDLVAHYTQLSRTMTQHGLTTVMCPAATREYTSSLDVGTIYTDRMVHVFIGALNAFCPTKRVADIIVDNPERLSTMMRYGITISLC